MTHAHVLAGSHKIQIWIIGITHTHVAVFKCTYTCTIIMHTCTVLVLPIDIHSVASVQLLQYTFKLTAACPSRL